jgi:hypothetical protein
MNVALRADDLVPDEPRVLAGRRRLYRVTTCALVFVLGLGVIDAIGWWHAYGVSSATVRDSAAGYELSVRYGAVSRPALATPFEIVVARAGGFTDPVVIAVDRRYLAMWDENGIMPAPSSETVDGDRVVWEFDPPRGTTLTVVYDGRIEPSQQTSRSGAVAVMEGEAVVASVEFTTRVMP